MNVFDPFRRPSRKQRKDKKGEEPMDLELPSIVVEPVEENVVKKIDFIRPLMKHSLVKAPSRLRYFEMNLTPVEYAHTLVQMNRFCVTFATTSSQVANFDVSFKNVIKGEDQPVRERKNDDCRCPQHQFSNAYAKMVQLYVKRFSGIEELKRLNQQDLMRQLQFCFCRFVSYNTAYFNWKEAMSEGFQSTLYKEMETLVEAEHLDAVHSDIDDLLLNDEEYEMLNTILFFTPGANLSPEGAEFLQKTRKCYVATLTEYLRYAYEPDFTASDVLVRNWQMLQILGNLGEMSEAMSRSFVLAAAFDLAHMKGNLTYDLHLREF